MKKKAFLFIFTLILLFSTSMITNATTEVGKNYNVPLHVNHITQTFDSKDGTYTASTNELAFNTGAYDKKATHCYLLTSSTTSIDTSQDSRTEDISVNNIVTTGDRSVAPMVIIISIVSAILLLVVFLTRKK